VFVIADAVESADRAVRAVINSDGVDTGWMDEAFARQTSAMHCSTGISLRDPPAETFSPRSGNPLGELRHGDDHVAALVPVVDIRVCVDDVVQGVGAVDHWPDITVRRELAERHQVVAAEFRCPVVD